MMMLKKGLEYKEKAQKQREEEASHEFDGCTFKPIVNSKFNNKVLKEKQEA